MAQIEKKQFAELCGIGTNDLSNYIKRGKVNVVEGLIDTDDQTNIYFYERRQKIIAEKKSATVEVDSAVDGVKTVPVESGISSVSKEQTKNGVYTATKGENEEKKTETLNDRVAKKKEKEVQPTFKFPEQAPLTRNSQIDNELKEEALKRERLNSQILQSKLSKTLGESVPTDLIRNILANHTKSIATAFKNGSENLILLFSAARELTPSELSELRKSLMDITNKAINEAVDESQATLKAITDEYSQKKEVGEREL